MSCEFIEPTPYVMPGWGCCQCRVYNGLQRKVCKRCGHKPCIELPKPEVYGLCNECGIPLTGNYRSLDGLPVTHTPDCSLIVKHTNKCNLCGHSMENNLHGPDQNDFEMNDDQVQYCGTCSYCKECNPHNEHAEDYRHERGSDG